MSDSSYVIITGTLEKKADPDVGKNSGKPYAVFTVCQESKWGYHDKDRKDDPPPLRRRCITFSQTDIKHLLEYEAGDEICVRGHEKVEAKISRSGNPWVDTTVEVEGVPEKPKENDDDLPFRFRPEEGR